MEKRVVEINGVKMEIDLRQAKVIENFKVGDTVKVLVKNYDGYKSYPGAIVGFDEFKALPTVVVAYLELSYSTAEIKYAYINAQTKDLEICAASQEEIPFERENIIDLLDREILKKEEDLRQARNKKDYFIRRFGRYFENLNPAT